MPRLMILHSIHVSEPEDNKTGVLVPSRNGKRPGGALRARLTNQIGNLSLASTSHSMLRYYAFLGKISPKVVADAELFLVFLSRRKTHVNRISSPFDLRGDLIFKEKHMCSCLMRPLKPSTDSSSLEEKDHSGLN